MRFVFTLSLALLEGPGERLNAREENPEGSSPKQAVETHCHAIQ